MTQSRVNPKKLIIEHYDGLINRVDIHIEEQLGKYTNTDVLQEQPKLIDYFNYSRDHQYKRSYKFEIPESTRYVPGTTLVWDYLNATRDELIKILEKGQEEALKHLETIKTDLNLDEECDDLNEKTEKVMEKLFAKSFPVVFHMNKCSKLYEYPWSSHRNKAVIQFHLVDIGFYISEQEIIAFLENFKLIRKGFIQIGKKVINIDSNNQKTPSPQIVDNVS